MCCNCNVVNIGNIDVGIGCFIDEKMIGVGILKEWVERMFF